MKKEVVNRIVRKFLEKVGWCEHSNLNDCNRCIAKWLREIIYEETKAPKHQ